LAKCKNQKHLKSFEHIVEIQHLAIAFRLHSFPQGKYIRMIFPFFLSFIMVLNEVLSRCTSSTLVTITGTTHTRTH